MFLIIYFVFIDLKTHVKINVGVFSPIFRILFWTDPYSLYKFALRSEGNLKRKKKRGAKPTKKVTAAIFNVVFSVGWGGGTKFPPPVPTPMHVGDKQFEITLKTI